MLVGGKLTRYHARVQPETSETPSFLFKGIFHVHTRASRDCALSVEKLIQRCIDEGIDVAAITDHGTIAGALAARQRAPFQVIVGEEIETAEGGEIIGLFLADPVQSGSTARAVIAAIRSQGGLVYLPHPFDPLRATRWPHALREILLREADIVETFNARTLFPAANARAAEAARHLSKAPCAGADAHFSTEIGRTVVYLSPFRTPGELVHSLRTATFQVERSPLWARPASGLVKILRRP